MEQEHRGREGEEGKEEDEEDSSMESYHLEFEKTKEPGAGTAGLALECC